MITDDHIRAYRDHGWFVLEDALDTGSLEVLRRECQRFMDERDAEMDAAGTDVMGLDRRGQRYFVKLPRPGDQRHGWIFRRRPRCARDRRRRQHRLHQAVSVLRAGRPAA
jgi:hypothetical protein